MPVVCRQFWGPDMQKTVIFHSCSLDRWPMSLFVQFIDRCGRRCDHAATLGLLLEVPQTQFIARVGRHSSAHRDGGLSAMVWWRCWLGIFCAPPGCPGVERQFFGALDDEEFFVVEGSCTNSYSEFVDINTLSEGPRRKRKQQQQQQQQQQQEFWELCGVIPQFAGHLSVVCVSLCPLQRICLS